jgi:hypothetical protein
MNEISLYLTEAQSYIDQFVPITLADAFFEATEDDKEANVTNDKAAAGAIGSLKNAIKAMVKTLGQIITKFTDFVKNQIQSVKYKNALKTAKKLVAQYPELGKVQVCVDDYAQYEKVYQDTARQLEAAARKDNFDQSIGDTIVENGMKKIEALKLRAKQAGKNFKNALTMDTVLKMADRNEYFAKALNAGLSTGLVDLKNFDSEITEAEASKNQKKIRRWAKNGVFHKLKIRIQGHQNSTFVDVIGDQVDMLTSFTNLEDGKVPSGKWFVDPSSIMKGTAKNAAFVNKATGGNAVQNLSDLNDARKKVDDTRDFINDTAKNAKGFSKFLFGDRKKK